MAGNGLNIPLLVGQMISSGEQLAFFGSRFEHPNTQFKNTISKSRIL